MTHEKLIEFIKITKHKFEALGKEPQNLYKHEYCLKVEKMLYHILYYKS